jgi:hypothetical protein
MSNLPITFGKTDIIKNPTLHLSYNFDKILSVESSISQLPITQDYVISALKLDLEGKTSNPNISLSIDSITRLFTLNACYISDKYPHKKDANLYTSFIIEGYSTEHVNRERVMICLPMLKSTDTHNIFVSLERAIVEKKNLEDGLDLNDYIPSISVDTDTFTYYKHSDNNGIVFHMIYFDTSRLACTAALKIPQNKDEYTSTSNAKNQQSIIIPKRHTNMTNQFEDNIYIDCVPVDFIEQNAKSYLRIDEKYADKFKDYLVYLVYFIIITLVVYGIYYIYIYSTKPTLPSPK